MHQFNCHALMRGGKERIRREYILFINQQIENNTYEGNAIRSPAHVLIFKSSHCVQYNIIIVL